MDYDDDDFDLIGQCALAVDQSGDLWRVPGTPGSNAPLTRGGDTRPPRGKGHLVLCGEEPEPYVHGRFNASPLVIGAVVAGQEATALKVENAYRVRHMRLLGLTQSDPDPIAQTWVVRNRGIVLLGLAAGWAALSLPLAVLQLGDVKQGLGGVVSAFGGAAVGFFLSALLLIGAPALMAAQVRSRRAAYAKKAGHAYGVPVYRTMGEAQGDWEFLPPITLAPASRRRPTGATDTRSPD